MQSIDEQEIMQATSCPAVSDEYAGHLFTLYAEKQWDGLPKRDDLVAILEKARETEEASGRNRLTAMLASTYTPDVIDIDGLDVPIDGMENVHIHFQVDDLTKQEWIMRNKPYSVVVLTVDTCKDFSPSYCKQNTTWRWAPWMVLLYELRTYVHDEAYRKERSLRDMLKSGIDALAMLLPLRAAHAIYVRQNYDECTKAYTTLKRVMDHVIDAYRSSEQKESR